MSHTAPGGRARTLLAAVVMAALALLPRTGGHQPADGRLVRLAGPGG